MIHPSQATRLDQSQEILTSKDSAEHPICGSKGEHELYTRLGLFTFASTVMALGDQPALHVSFGPPDTAPYRRFELGLPAASRSLLPSLASCGIIPAQQQPSLLLPADPVRFGGFRGHMGASRDL